MGTGDCINIFMAAQPCNTANGNCMGIASISSWLLSPVTLQMGTRDCTNIFMAAQPCHISNGYWGLHQYLHGYSALSHCKWELGIASIGTLRTRTRSSLKTPKPRRARGENAVTRAGKTKLRMRTRRQRQSGANPLNSAKHIFVL